MGEFGDKFRKARESKELSLDDVANVTKISTRMLQAIEEEHFDHLPGGVFNRGFIRAYAKHLGLNSEDAVNDYLACLRQAQIDSHNGWDAEKPRDPHQPVAANPSVLRAVKPVAKVQPPAPAPVQVEELPELQLPRIEHVRPPKKEYLGRPSSGISWMRIAAAVCVLIAVFFLWSRYTRSTRAARATPITAPTSQAPAPSAAAPLSPSAQTSAAPAPPTQVAASTPSPSTEPAKPTAPAPQPVANTPAPAQKAEISEDPNAVKVQKKGDVTIRSFGAATAKPAEKSATTIKLVVRASENSWISITADGQLVTQETLIAPAATSFHATRELVVRVGNAAGISFLWNGEEFSAQGAEAEAKTFIFDAQGMHAATSPPQN